MCTTLKLVKDGTLGVGARRCGRHRFWHDLHRYVLFGCCGGRWRLSNASRTTGVAYSSAPEWTDPKTIVHWPGRATHETRNKVDTCVAYDARFQSLRSWGFECNENDVETDVNKLFKLFLDPRFIDESGFAPAYSEVQRWYVDYQSGLDAYVNSYLQERMARFALKNVEWVFSIPTTWKDPSMIAGIESMIRDAGYGKELDHKVAISLTEAEAAAVYVSK